MSNTIAIENALIKAQKDLEKFSVVASVGREDRPNVIQYPSCFVYFIKDTRTGVGSRPVTDMEFGMLIVNKNLRGETEAAQDTYELLDAARDAVEGKKLGLEDIQPFRVLSREIARYESGVIDYLITVGTKHDLPVPTPDF